MAYLIIIIGEQKRKNEVEKRNSKLIKQRMRREIKKRGNELFYRLFGIRECEKKNNV